MKIKKILGLTLNVPISDSISEYDLDPNYLNEITDQIERAKKSADFIFFCVHVGGQFNDKPGDYTKYIMNFAIDKGVDAIIGTHPHVVQKAELIKGKPVFYSLGNFSFSPSSIYVLHDLLPEYSIAPHFYFTNTDSGISLKKITYSVLKTIESDTHQVYVHDVYDLLNHSLENKDLLRIDLDFVNKRLMGSDNHLREYEGEFEIFSK